MMITKTVALCLCVLGLAASVAVAQGPSKTGYGETGVLPETSSGGDSDPPAGTRGTSPAAGSGAGDAPSSVPEGASADPGRASLPLTGQDVGVVVLAALALLAVGVGLRTATVTPLRS